MAAKAKAKAAPSGAFTKVATMPPARRRRRDSWLKLIGAASWEELFDGEAYKIELPKLTDQPAAMDDFIRAARQAFGYRNRRSGGAQSMITDKQSDRIVLIQVVDK